MPETERANAPLFCYVCSRLSRKTGRIGSVTSRLDFSQTFGANGHEPDALALDKLQRLVDVRQLVDAHLAAVGLGQLFAGDDLEQQHQLEAVAKVLLDRLDLRAGLAQMRVAPRRESLQRNVNVCSQHMN